MDFAAIDRLYQAYIKRVAFDEYSAAAELQRPDPEPVPLPPRAE